MRLFKMLFFLCFRPTITFQGGSRVDPLFEPPADPPFDSTSQKLFLSSFGVSDYFRNNLRVRVILVHPTVCMRKMAHVFPILPFISSRFLTAVC